MRLGRGRLALGAIVALAIALLAFSVLTTGGADAPVGGGGVQGTVAVSFEGSPSPQATRTANFRVEPGTNAWTAIQHAVGPNNLKFQDFGADLGIFITSFYGVDAQEGHFWEFRVNGQSSEIGVSGYIVRDGDRLEFRYSRF